ncbi:uncharacterized protein LOC130010644 [Patella vulgata]|uniref:uncharacterized protein LOC130010644 n=1 Tax=Patella vulgata TaxID=6465 RepID=UPI0024A9297A|nr:uncharacterized protein LOC130010644 [Patella vulgata]
MKPHLYLSPWLPRIMLLHLCTLLTVQAVVPGLTSTPKTINEPLLDVPKPSCSGVPSDFCKNNGTCREPRDDELWECSGDAGIGPLKCDCPTGFTGSRCETKLSCVDLSCKKGEICDFNWSKQQLECIPLNTSGQLPTCKPGIHDIEFKYDKVNIQKSIVCFPMYEFDSSSLCSDPDDSLTYLLAQGPPELPDLFCLVVDYQYYRTCLRVNATHRDRITMTDARVDVFAEEYSVLERKARLQLNIIFNKPPVVSKPIVSWIVNSAELRPFDVISEAGVTSSFDLTPGEVYTIGSTALVPFINPTGQLELTPQTTILDLKRLQVIVQVTDDGIPSLSSNVTVQVTVATLSCQTQGQITVDIRDLNSLTSSTPAITIGQIDCTSSTGYQLDYTLLNNPFLGLTVSLLEGGIQLSRNGDTSINSQTQSVDATISMQRFPRVTSDVTFTIQIGYLSLVWFKLTNITWNKEYTNTSSNSYITLKQRVETEIVKLINNTRVEVRVIQFRPDFWVDVVVESINETLLNQKSKMVVDEAKTGLIGTLKINKTAVYNATGSSHLFKPAVDFVTNFTTSIYFLEETRVVVVCSVDYINPTGGVDVDWTLDGAKVRPLSTSRFQVSTQQMLPWRIRSTLTISNVKRIDTGELSCRARDVAGRIAHTETRLEVLSPPVVRIVPNTPAIFVQTGTEITLTCDVATPGVKTSFTWQSSAEKKVTAGQNITLTISQDTSLTCNGTNEAGQGQPKTTKILVIPGEVTCPTESDSRNTPWLQTTPGFTAEHPCPTGYTGIASRVCDSEGKWEEPNYDSCIQDKVVEIQNTIAKLEAGVFVAEPEELVANLTDIAERPLERNEIITMTRAISALTTIKSNINSTRRQENTKQFAMQSLNLVGNLVDSKHNLTGVDSENTSVSLLLLDTMDQVSSLWGNTLPEGSSGTITAKNIVCTVGKTDPFNISDVIYPANQSSPGASAQLPSSIFRSESEFEPIVFSLITYNNLSSLPVTVNSNLTRNDTGSKRTFEINSDVLTISIFPGAADFDSSKLKSDVIFTFSHINTSLSNATCSYWDIQDMSWNNDGCVVISTNDTSTTCSCNHLTNFALLMKPTSPNTNGGDRSTLSTITLIGCTISIFCLLLTVLTYAFVWRYVKSDRAIALVNLCIALIVIFLFIFVGCV